MFNRFSIRKGCCISCKLPPFLSLNLVMCLYFAMAHESTQGFSPMTSVLEDES